MRRLFLHIGRSKTGSSAIQRALSLRRDTLRRMGIVYPGQGLDHEDIVFAMSDALSSRRLSRDDSGPVKQACALMEEVQAHVGSAIISSEGFSILPPEDVRRWFDGFDVQIVVYIREQAEAFASSYQQEVQGRLESASFAAFAARYVVDYHAYLCKWAGVFGHENLHVRVYDRAELTGGDVVSDFLSIAGVADVESFRIEGGDANPSLAGAPLEAKRRLNALCDQSGERAILEATYRYLQDAALSDPANRGRIAISDDLIASIRERHLASNAALAREFLGRAFAFNERKWPDVAPFDEAAAQRFHADLVSLAKAHGVRLTAKAPQENWRDYTRRRANQTGTEAVVLSNFDAFVAIGDHPADACWDALVGQQ